MHALKRRAEAKSRDLTQKGIIIFATHVTSKMLISKYKEFLNMKKKNSKKVNGMRGETNQRFNK